MKTMQASNIRADFASVLEAVREKGEAVVVVRYGRPVAALVPLDRLAPYELMELKKHEGRAVKRDDVPS